MIGNLGSFVGADFAPGQLRAFYGRTGGGGQRGGRSAVERLFGGNNAVTVGANLGRGRGVSGRLAGSRAGRRGAAARGAAAVRGRAGAAARARRRG